jgi:hypothetical protein
VIVYVPRCVQNGSESVGFKALKDFERNINVGLKKLSQVLSEQTRDSSAYLNAMRLFKVLNFERL